MDNIQQQIKEINKDIDKLQYLVKNVLSPKRLNEFNQLIDKLKTKIDSLHLITKNRPA
jgi:predicted  nucleic acid-binding Zn-ribbon protein